MDNDGGEIGLRHGHPCITEKLFPVLDRKVWFLIFETLPSSDMLQHQSLYGGRSWPFVSIPGIKSLIFVDLSIFCVDFEEHERLPLLVNRYMIFMQRIFVRK